jgi:hypothetical protein
LAFVGGGTSGSPLRLFPVVEYDYTNSAYLDGVQLKDEKAIEMTAQPTVFAWTNKDTRPFFVVANTEKKLGM